MIQSMKKCFFIALVLSSEFNFNSCAEELGNIGSDENSGPGEPLFLTPLIEKGSLAEARRKASVKSFVNGVESYAGYLTVDKKYNSNLFFWFFKAQDKKWENLPVAVWLQGGPGATSLMGLFVENGPYILTNTTLNARLYSWHRKCNMIYVDNPVGSGFSFTDRDEGYTKNQTAIGQQLYSAIKQFFILFPNLSKNDFYLSGESYAGKYVPAFAYTIHKNNIALSGHGLPLSFQDKVFINLKGLFIGNGLVDPYNMMEYGDYLYQLGLVDTNTRNKFHIYERQIRRAINTKKWSHATNLFGEMVLAYIYNHWGSLFQNATGFHQHYNYYNSNPSGWNSRHKDFVNSDLFRRSVHVGGRPFSDGKKTAEALKHDILKSVVGLVGELLNHYRIVFYNGQLDVICAYPLTVNFIQKMNWSSAEEYSRAERNTWKVGKDIAGYYKIAGNLTEVLVRDAGHMVPSDQPLWAFELFNKFILQ